MIMLFSQFAFAELLVYSKIGCEEILKRKFPKIFYQKMKKYLKYS